MKKKIDIKYGKYLSYLWPKKEAEWDKITMYDINKALHHLGAHPTWGEIKEMIWEVDDDLDGMINYDELITMYKRCSKDESGLEPKKFFNLVLFLMYDKDNKAKIIVEDTL